MASTLDDFLVNVATPDTRKRIQAHADLVPYLSDPSTSLECDDLDQFIDGLTGWVSSSNYKISLNGIEVLCLLINRIGEGFHRHVTTVLPAVVDRLGDNKEQVREQAKELLLKLMMPASSPQYVFDRMQKAFSHKLWLVRDGALVCLQKTINTYGAKCLKLSFVVPDIVRLLEDQNSQVRESAVNTLAEIYRHVGEKVRSDLSRKGLSQNRLTQIYARFDELRAAGEMLPTADMTSSRTLTIDDDGDFARPQSIKPPKRLAPSSGIKKPPSSIGATSRIAGPSTTSSSAGGVDEALFQKSFEDVPKVTFFSARELQDHINKIRDALTESGEDWEKRVTMLKTLRALVMQGAADHDDFLQQLRVLQPCLLVSVKDLRSQVVREACITLAYLAQQLGGKFDQCAEVVLQNIINLIPNSAKVMSSSGIVCIRFIIQYTHSARLIPIVTGCLISKSNIIRRNGCELLHTMLHSWPTHVLEKHIAALQDAIKRGINDADSDARSFARKAFWGFADHFRDQAESLMNGLDASKKKMLEGELSTSSSSNSINSCENYRTPAHRGRVRSASVERTALEQHDMRYLPKGHKNFSSAKSDCGDTEDREPVSRQTSTRSDTRYDSKSLNRGGVYNALSRPANHAATARATNGYKSSTAPRSSSALNLTVPESVRTPKTASGGTRSLVNYPIGSTKSLPRGKQASGGSKYGISAGSSRYGASSTMPDRGRIKAKSSQSQPTSRSTSPSSRLSYITHNNAQPGSTTPGSTRKAFGYRSQGSSRDASPNRVGVMGQRMIAKSQDVEQAVADALKGPSSRRRYESYDSDDAASETSSICSDNSFRSYNNGSEDVNDIITNMTSGSYADRKQGLLALQHCIATQYTTLSRVELKKITEIFTRMFHDPNNKVVSVFFETLPMFVSVYHAEITDWLYVLITRLLTKMGVDLLPSLMVRAQKALDAVRDSFLPELQFHIITRYIIDQTQTPTLKTKVSMLTFLQTLASRMDAKDLVDTCDTRVALSRIIHWTIEPKSVDVRKGSQAVLTTLFTLNPHEFSRMLSQLPKTFQDEATKVLHNHQKSANNEPDVLSPRNLTSPPSRLKPVSRSSVGHRDDAETENMNPEEIYNSIRKTTADIQNLSYGSIKLEKYNDAKRKREFTSQDSGIQDLRIDSPDDKKNYNSMQYQENSGMNRTNLTGALYDVENDLFNEEPLKTLLGLPHSEEVLPNDQNEMITQILQELSNHNKRNDERKNAMLSLMHYTRVDSFELWDEHYKTILLILLETLGDNDGHIRALALRSLKEILIHQPHRFKDYAELTILRILEAHKDLDKEVVKSAEECASTFATTIPPEQSLRILNSIVQSESYPVLLAAIKMQTKVIEQLPPSTLKPLLCEIVPGLIKGYDDAESSVRKASVFCFVAIHKIVGEALQPHLSQLTSGKMKLLNLYIKRSEAQTSSGKVTPVDAI